MGKGDGGASVNLVPGRSRCVLTALPRYGIWTLFLWVYLLNRNTLSWTMPRWNYVAMTAVLVAVAAFAAVRWSDDAQGGGRVARRLDVAAALGMTGAGTLLAVNHLFGGNDSLVPGAVFLGGLFLAWLYLRWALFFASVELRSALRYLFAGCIVWVFAQLVLETVLDALSYPLLVAMPLLSCWMLHRALPAGIVRCAPIDVRFRARDVATLGKSWATVVAASLVVSTLTVALPEFDSVAPVVKRGISIAVLAGMLWWVTRPGRSFDFATLWRVVFIILAVAITATTIPSLEPFAVTFLFSAWNVLMPIVWITVCDIARHCDLHPYTVLGAGLSMYTLPSAFGGTVFRLVGDIDGFDALLAMLYLVLVVVLAVCLGSRDPDMLRVFEDLRDDQPGVEEFRTIASCCERIGRERGLTSREVEIMRMACEGRSRAYIAETLLISENTVKTHLGHVYEKLDVHSRKELQKLIGV